MHATLDSARSAQYDAVGELGTIATKAGLPLTELALRWVAHRPGVSGVLLGGSRLEHITANVAALAAGPLDPEVVTACDEVGAALRGPMPPYNR